jgi:hypothetical protein
MNGSEKSFEENNGQETGGGESAEALEVHAAVSGASAPSPPGLMTVTSDEVNYLIFRYGNQLLMCIHSSPPSRQLRLLFWKDAARFILLTIFQRFLLTNFHS